MNSKYWIICSDKMQHKAGVIASLGSARTQSVFPDDEDPAGPVVLFAASEKSRAFDTGRPSFEREVSSSSLVASGGVLDIVGSCRIRRETVKEI